MKIQINHHIQRKFILDMCGQRDYQKIATLKLKNLSLNSILLRKHKVIVNVSLNEKYIHF